MFYTVDEGRYKKAILCYESNKWVCAKIFNSKNVHILCGNEKTFSKVYICKLVNCLIINTMITKFHEFDVSVYWRHSQTLIWKGKPSWIDITDIDSKS